MTPSTYPLMNLIHSVYPWVIASLKKANVTYRLRQNALFYTNIFWLLSVLLIVAIFYPKAHEVICVFDTQMIINEASKDAISHHLSEKEAKRFSQLLHQKIEEALNVYAKEHKTVVIEKTYIKSGGKDITPLIVAQLKRKKGD